MGQVELQEPVIADVASSAVLKGSETILTLVAFSIAHLIMVDPELAVFPGQDTCFNPSHFKASAISVVQYRRSAHPNAGPKSTPARRCNGSLAQS